MLTGVTEGHLNYAVTFCVLHKAFKVTVPSKLTGAWCLMVEAERLHALAQATKREHHSLLGKPPSLIVAQLLLLSHLLAGCKKSTSIHSLVWVGSKMTVEDYALSLLLP